MHLDAEMPRMASELPHRPASMSMGTTTWLPEAIPPEPSVAVSARAAVAGKKARPAATAVAKG